MFNLRNRFLNTAAVLLKPDDEGANDAQETQAGGAQEDNGGKSTTLNEDAGAEDDGGAGEDDDDPLAGLAPEVRAKVEKKLQKEIGWRDRQIDRLHAKRRSAEGDAEAARAIVERQQRAPAKADKTVASTDIDAEVERRAALKAAQSQYDRDCENTDTAGRAAYGDKWNASATKLAKMGGLTVDDMVNVLATDNPEVVIFTLSQNPDEYERVMALSPARRNAAFVKLGLKEAPKPVDTTESKRPADDARPPPRSIQGSRQSAVHSRVDLYSKDVDDDDWYRARNEQRRKKFSNVE